MTGPSEPRVVMVALDAQEWRVFEHLLGSGALPNLARFVGETGHAMVKSDGDTLHGSLWPTFATGANPGFHGMYFWTQWLQEEMGYARNSHPALAIEPFWERMAEDGLPLTLIDVPYMPPVRRPNVQQVIAWGTHDEIEPGEWPAGYLAAFRKRFGKNPLSFDTVEPQGTKEKLKMVGHMRRGVEMRARATQQLLSERPGPGFFLSVFGETHKAGHYLAAPQQLSESTTSVTAIAEILEPLDRAWPAILEAAGPDSHVFLFSLHGMVEQVDYSGTLGSQLLALAMGKQAVAGVPPPDLLRRVRNVLPDSVHRAIWRRLPGRFRAARQGTLSSAGVDLERDPVFRIAHDGHLGLRKNLVGRERDGRFLEGDAEAALERLETLASGLRTPDGRMAFESLLRIPGRFHGPRLDRLPDALLLANTAVAAAHEVVGPDGLTLTNDDPEARNGVHTDRGFVFFRPALNSPIALRGEVVDNRDFAPSLLQLFAKTPPPHYEGSSFLR